MTTTRTLIPERPGRVFRLGRHQEWDERNHLYHVRRTGTVVDVDHTATGLPLNQGSVGSCTANALCGALNLAPDFTPPAKTETDASTLYEKETCDEGTCFDGTGGDATDIGGTSLAVCKAGMELGWLSGYNWATDLNSALLALDQRPVITGVNWYDSFDTPDANGVISISANASVEGGHEIVARQIVTASQLVGFWNSWGSTWGPLGGMFYMSYATWERLLGEGGDCAQPLPISQPAPTPSPTPPAPSPGGCASLLTLGLL